MYPISKRLLDIVISSSLLLLLAPFLVVIALAIKLDSSGPILFVQKVVGLSGCEFMLLKFRTMHPGSQDKLHRADIERNVRNQIPTQVDSRGQPIFKTAFCNSKRITRLGRLLRRTSVDELPQLWNVLIGDMSLVGPRPSVPWEVALYSETQRRRLLVKPGMTGLYQVTKRNRVPVDEMIRIDLEYGLKCSLWMDLKLLARTPFAMFNGL